MGFTKSAPSSPSVIHPEKRDHILERHRNKLKFNFNLFILQITQRVSGSLTGSNINNRRTPHKKHETDCSSRTEDEKFRKLIEYNTKRKQQQKRWAFSLDLKKKSQQGFPELQ